MRLVRVGLACSLAIASGYTSGAAPASQERAAVEAAKAGWSIAALDELAAYVQSQKSTGFLIIQDRRVIYEHNWPLPPEAANFAANFTHGTDARGALQEDVASAQKSFIAILAGVAIDKGLLDISKPASAYIGTGWSKAAPEQEKLITVRHLLEMNSGLTELLAHEAPAGTRFFYNTPAYAFMKPVLEKASGQTLDDLTRAWLTKPAGMTDTLWRRRPAAFAEVGNPTGLYTTPSDMAKVGQLVLDKGKAADGTRVISEAQLAALFERSPTNPAYGRLWWLNGSAYALLPAGARTETALIPAAPADLVAALGAQDRKIYVARSRKLIVVRTGQTAPDRGFNQQLWLRLMKAAPKDVTSNRPAQTTRSFTPGSVRSFDVVPLETVSETSSNASIGDLNGDGHPDIVLVKGRHWQVTTLVFYGDGKGHFAAGPALPSKANKSYSGSLADMTRSGHLDIVLSNDEPDPKLILLNDGKGNFRIGGHYGDPKWPTRNAAVADLNGDGYPDIAVANRGVTSYVCLNDGKLNFACHPLSDSPSAATVAIADIDGDGTNDVIYACRDSCQSTVYFNDGMGRFNRKTPWGVPKSSVRAMAVADFDGDGHLDIAACPENLGCFVFFNDGKGSFGDGVRFDTPQPVPYSMLAGDLNRDGRPDILVGYVGAPGVAYFNNGTGRSYRPLAFGDRQGAIYGMAAADLDGDGWPDVVVARSDASSFVMFNRPPKE